MQNQKIIFVIIIDMVVIVIIIIIINNPSIIIIRRYWRFSAKTVINLQPMGEVRASVYGEDKVDGAERHVWGSKLYEKLLGHSLH